jgi:hypothetical protein
MLSDQGGRSQNRPLAQVARECLPLPHLRRLPHRTQQMSDTKTDRIRSYRDTHECGMAEAKHAIEREDRLLALDSIEQKLGSPWPRTRDQGVRELVALLREII